MLFHVYSFISVYVGLFDYHSLVEATAPFIQAKGQQNTPFTSSLPLINLYIFIHCVCAYYDVYNLISFL